MKQAIIQEIINDIIAIDPELKNIKSELEKLVQELIANKPQTPFTKEFKDFLKAQIIGAINEQKILYEEKKRNRDEMLHSLKFWMIGVSTVTAGFLMFTLFHYIEDIQQPSTQIAYFDNSLDLNNMESESDIIQEETTKEETKIKTMSDDRATESFWGWASNRADNVMMLAIPESTPENQEPVAEFSMMKMMMVEDESMKEDDDLARREFASEEATATTATSPNPFCETSNQFLLANNITDNSTKTFTYDNQIYKATINFTNNSITIDHIGTQDDSKTQTEIPNLNLFFEKNNFKIKSDYLSPIIEDSENSIEYYYPRNNNQEGITVRIDKESNIIFSIQNICLYQ